ncbi:UDP-N-acetylglucosamine 4,6-dehydratase family protein [Anoxynatronum buryatiense]|uniref:Polysaccharide biosynthesis protein n=1 Tax=Anoxynatronum buryatiense TaxID=489973 RepID=A0AA45WVG6_9CLOT|nr:UDP-N-acetylglucosamine 4,6-dehydratase family protein [Anoxynatronum buryatiense]SMP52519.1 Polysaccharide biosynthesis protein [Anoxynatronum buryatiense]
MFRDKNILIIGGTGTVGQALLRSILKDSPRVVRIYSRDEFKQFLLQEELTHHMKTHNNLRFLLGDVRDEARLDRAMNGIDIVFDLAALKHVPACEYNPFEAVKTNVMGTQNVIECALKNKVKRVIYTSSDKAVAPTNTMGATKLLAERLISSADYSKGQDQTIFAAVRFGNVLDSRGSVLPLWKDQIQRERIITVTEPEMTRFFMHLQEAVTLIRKACEIARGGEIFVLKMPSVKLGDLAKAAIHHYCQELNLDPQTITIKTTGLRPGEKMYEELMTEDEAMYAVEHEDMFCIRPRTKQISQENGIRTCPYSSKLEENLSIDQISRLLLQSRLF